MCLTPHLFEWLTLIKNKKRDRIFRLVFYMLLKIKTYFMFMPYFIALPSSSQVNLTRQKQTPLRAGGVFV